MAYDGSIKIDTKIDIEGAKQGLKDLKKKTSKEMDDLRKTANDGLDNLNSVAGKAALGISAAIGIIAGTGIKFNSEIEQYKASFETMLGSAEKANKMFDDLQKFAAETPFEMSDLAKGTQTLLAFGISAEDVMPTLKMLGDVSLGNKDRFDSLSLAFGQVQSAGRLMGQDLLQMINAGFNPLQVISKNTGISMSELKKRMEDGAISAQMVADAFKVATSEGGQFYGAMEKQSKTAAGQWSTLIDNVKTLLGELTAGLSDIITNTILPKAIEGIQKISDEFRSGELQKNAAKVAASIASIGTAIVGLNVVMIIKDIDAAFKGLEVTTTLVKNAQAALNLVVYSGPWGWFAIAVSAATAALLVYNLVVGDSENKVKMLSKEVEELSKSYERAKKAAEDSENAELAKAATAKDLTNELYDLNEQVKSGTLSDDESSEAKKRMNSIADQLKQILPQVAIEFDNVTGAVKTEKKAVDDLIDSLVNLAKTRAISNKMQSAYEALIATRQKVKEAEAGAYGAKYNIDYYTNDKNGITNNMQYAGDPVTIKYATAINQAKSDLESYNKIIQEGNNELEKYQQEIDSLKDISKDLGLQTESLTEKTEDLGNTFKKNAVSGVSSAKSTGKSEEDLTDKMIAERNKRFRDLKFNLDMGYIKESEYYEQIGKLRDEYFEEGSEDWQKHTVEIFNYIQKQKQQITQMYTDIAVAAGQEFDKILALQNRMAEKLKGYGENLFNQISITYGGKTTSYTQLTDFSADIRALEAYKNAIQAVRDRGAPQEFMSILKDMSVEEGTQFANALAKASDAEYDRYISQWQTKQETAAEISRELYADETQAVIEDWKKEFEKAGMEVPEGFFDSGVSAAENFGEGFLDKINEVMEQIRKAVAANMANMMPMLSFTGGLPVVGGGVTSTTYNNNFTIGSTKNTASEQIQQWRAASEVQKLRGN